MIAFTSIVVDHAAPVARPTLQARQLLVPQVLSGKENCVSLRLGQIVASGTAACLATYSTKRLSHRRLKSNPRAGSGLWDELDDDDSDFLGGGGQFKVPNRKGKKGTTDVKKGSLDHFKPGGDFSAAKRFAETRVFTVAPWSEDVKPKPILAVSDMTGSVALQLAKTGFTQFGRRQLADVSVLTDVKTEEAVVKAVREAANFAPSDALSIEKSGALVIYTLGSPSLSKFFEDQCAVQGVPCVNALEPLYTAFEKRFDMKRDSDGCANAETVFVVSDTTGYTTLGMVEKALVKFPGCCVEAVTVCPNVDCVPEVNYIVDEATRQDSPIVFSFASPGLSRYIRQQCERAQVKYADAFQPMMISMEKYLDYPPVCIPGGYSQEKLDVSSLKWEKRAI